MVAITSLVADRFGEAGPTPPAAASLAGILSTMQPCGPKTRRRDGFRQQLDRSSNPPGPYVDELRYLLQSLRAQKSPTARIDATQVRKSFGNVGRRSLGASSAISERRRSRDFLESMDTAALLAAADELIPTTSRHSAAAPRHHHNASCEHGRPGPRASKGVVVPEDSAGPVNTDAITVRPRHSLELVLRYLRRCRRCRHH
jgi:hypothetical protein